MHATERMCTTRRYPSSASLHYGTTCAAHPSGSMASITLGILVYEKHRAFAKERLAIEPRINLSTVSPQTHSTPVQPYPMAWYSSELQMYLYTAVQHSFYPSPLGSPPICLLQAVPVSRSWRR